MAFEPDRAPPLIAGIAAQHHQQALFEAAPNLSHLHGQMTFGFAVVSRSTGRVLKQHVLICMPEHYSATPEARTAVQYTAKGVYFDALAEVGLTHFAAEGHTLFRGVKLTNGVTIDGAAAFRDLVDTWEFYVTGNSVKPAISGHDPTDLMLTFVDQSWPQSLESAGAPEWVIHPQGTLVTLDRRRDKPFLYHYRLQFVAIKRDVRSERPPGPQARPEVRSILQELGDLMRNMTSIDALATYVVGETIGAQGVAMIELAQQYRTNVQTVVTLLEQFSAGATSVVDSCFERVNQALADATSIRDSVLSFADLVSGGAITDEHSYVLNETRRIRHRLNAVRLLSDVFGSAARSRISDYYRRVIGDGGKRAASKILDATGEAAQALAGAVAPTFGGFTEYQLQQGDTLESIASSAGVPAAVLIELNNLLFPYLDTSQTRPATDPLDAQGRHVLYVGESIVLPTQAPEVVPGAATSRNEIILPIDTTTVDGSAFTVEERLFGSDLRIDLDKRDLVLNEALGDLDTVGGLDNLMQSLALGWALRPGQLAHDPNRGNHLLDSAGTYASDASIQSAYVQARNTLLQNPRIATIQRLKVSAYAGKVNVEFGVVAINGARLAEQEFASAGGA